MNRFTTIILLVCAFFLTQCRAYKEVVETEAPNMVGLVGLKEACLPADTVHSVLIHKAESLIITEDERYEATVTIYAVKDSLIYMSAVNSGFEILRATVEPDTIRVIDRLNKVVYQTPVKKGLVTNSRLILTMCKISYRDFLSAMISTWPGSQIFLTLTLTLTNP